MTDSAHYFAEKLLQIKALKLNVEEPFTWASGWHSPIYCDNRKTLSYPHIRDYVKTEIANIILDKLGDAEVIAGVATAGIPHGALVADILKLPFIYVRSKPKGHGLGNQIEGVFEANQKVVVIEDLVSTGKSSMEAVEALRTAGANVIGMCALFTYGFPQAQALMEKEQVPLYTLSNYEALISLLQTNNQLEDSQIATLKEWRTNPDKWNQ